MLQGETACEAPEPRGRSTPAKSFACARVRRPRGHAQKLRVSMVCDNSRSGSRKRHAQDLGVKTRRMLHFWWEWSIRGKPYDHLHWIPRHSYGRLCYLLPNAAQSRPALVLLLRFVRKFGQHRNMCMHLFVHLWSTVFAQDHC